MKTNTIVTTNDGTRYKVVLDEQRSRGVLSVKIYVKRRKFPGYRHISDHHFRHGDGMYNRDSPDFIRIVRVLVFYAHCDAIDIRPGAVRLRNWDGRVDV